jgi:hypothetical protein
MTAGDVKQATDALVGGRGLTHDAGFYERILATYAALRARVAQGEKRIRWPKMKRDLAWLRRCADDSDGPTQTSASAKRVIAALSAPAATPETDTECLKCEDGAIEYLIDGSASKTARTFCSCPRGVELRASYHKALEAKGEERAR